MRWLWRVDSLAVEEATGCCRHSSEKRWRASCYKLQPTLQQAVKFEKTPICILNFAAIHLNPAPSCSTQPGEKRSHLLNMLGTAVGVVETIVSRTV